MTATMTDTTTTTPTAGSAVSRAVGAAADLAGTIDDARESVRAARVLARIAATEAVEASGVAPAPLGAVGKALQSGLGRAAPARVPERKEKEAEETWTRRMTAYRARRAASVVSSQGAAVIERALAGGKSK